MGHTEVTPKVTPEVTPEVPNGPVTCPGRSCSAPGDPFTPPAFWSSFGHREDPMGCRGDLMKWVHRTHTIGSPHHPMRPLRGRKGYVRFARLDDRVTHVTLVVCMFRSHATTVHARLLTFRDVGVAFVDRVDVFEHDGEYERDRWHGQTIPEGMAEDMKPEGIRELRRDGLAAFELARACFFGVTHVRQLAESLEPHLPQDVVGIVCDAARKGASPSGSSSLHDRPFKVQHKDFYTKRPAYRIVDRRVPPTDAWEDFSDSDSDD